MLTLDSDFSEKLKAVLSDPEAMAKITAIASGLGKTGAPSESQPPSPPQEEPSSLPDLSGNGIDALNALSGGFSSPHNDPRVSLLHSLKPLLREEKRDRVDALARALALAAMMKNFRK